MRISEDVSETPETARCCLTCFHDGSFVIWIASWNALVCGLEMCFGFGHVFVLSGRDFGCRNALELWNDASAGRKTGVRRGKRESEARRRYSREVIGVRLSFVSTEVSKWRGRHTKAWICAAVHGRIR